MNYKVGDKAKVRTDLKKGKYYGDTYMNDSMTELKGDIVTIEGVGEWYYLIKEDGEKYLWSDAMLEPVEEHEKTVNMINSIEEQTITLDDLKDIKENNILPAYYHKGAVDTIQFCLENNLDFLQGNIIKYVVRYKEKNGLEDLKKAQEYLRRLIESEEKKVSDINE